MTRLSLRDSLKTFAKKTNGTQAPQQKAHPEIEAKRAVAVTPPTVPESALSERLFGR